MEIIARRKSGLFFLYGFVGLVGLLIFIICAVYNIWFSAILGLVILGISAAICIVFCKTPKIIIQYDGENLIFPEGVHSVSTLTNATYYRAHARGIRYRWGKLVVFIDGKEYSYNYVANVEEVHNRLIALKMGVQ